MQLLVSTWTMRLATVAAGVIGFVSYQAGTPVIECVDRALAVAVGFTLGGRFLLGWLEPPEVRMLKMRRRRELKRAKAMKAATTDSVAAARARRSTSTISRSA
jgi:hypothetical protein